ncbi:probable cysteine desulfurase [Patiria miniata]|uniref:Aminotransferase class V domain-containing protein n=1 Tax=Patiria miniata TaxID=46514 RepID=A0A914BRW3_PATMI|nr:probable cysteine desulfurase [Patiria miniata]
MASSAEQQAEIEAGPQPETPVLSPKEEPLSPKQCRFSLLVETTDDFMPITTTTNLAGVTEDGGRGQGEEDKDLILRYVEDNVVGKDTCFPGPFGEKQVIYCDYTASGRPLKFIEDYITNHVHPLYANTHTTTGLMARQTSQFRKEAREIIKRCVNATDEDVVIFTGSGTTGAVHKLVTALELKGERAKKTVVFVGPYEHHSNILPWKESGAKVIRIRDADRGQIDMKLLEQKLKHYQHRSRFMIGCFSAASNVTGIVTDSLAVASLLHQYGALSFWDYATAGPYLNIDMNPVLDLEDEAEAEEMEPLDFSKDAVYLSPHKFVGGVGTPGLLIAKKKLFMNAVPGAVGGGTVLYVTRDTHRYVSNIEEREEGGTPAIVESIRAGLVFRLKESITPALIEEREHDLSLLAFKTWRRNPNLIFLGSTRAERLPIFSFLIVHTPSGKVLHHNYVAALLNDLYGIQARGGCACAGPYAQDLLGIDEPMAAQFADFLVDTTRDEMPATKGKKNGKKAHKHKALEVMKPGFTRLNLPFFFSAEVTDFVLKAINDVASNGWKLLPQYDFDVYNGSWIYQNPKGESDEPSTETAPASDSLLTTSFVKGEFKAPPSPFVSRKKYVQTTKLQETMQIASVFYSEAEAKCKEVPDMAQDDEFIDAVGDPSMVWFLQPHEALAHLRDPTLDQTDAGTDSSAALRLKVKNVPFKPRQSTARRSRFSRRSRSRKSHQHQAKETGKRTMKMCTVL